MGILESQLAAISLIQESEKLIDGMIEKFCTTYSSNNEEYSTMMYLLTCIRKACISHGEMEEIHKTYLADDKENKKEEGTNTEEN